MLVVCNLALRSNHKHTVQNRIMTRQYEQITSEFNGIDADGDGVVTQDEWTDGAPSKYLWEYIKEFRAIDSNNDGEVTLAEYIDAYGDDY